MGRADQGKEWTTKDNLIRLEGWARDGLTDKQIALYKIGCSEVSFTRWKTRYPEIKIALKKGKEPVDIKVENALLKRALGYEVEESSTEVYEENGVKKKHIKRTVKQIPPDVTAQIFWLKNRRPDKWRDKWEVVDGSAVEKLDEILDAVKTSAENEVNPISETK